jgi:hypothetical protein
MASLHSGADIACGVFILVGKEGPADKREARVGQGVGEARRKYHTTIAHDWAGTDRRVQNAVVVGNDTSTELDTMKRQAFRCEVLSF